MPLSDASRHITEHIKAFHRNQTVDVEALVRVKVMFKLGNQYQMHMKHFSQTFVNNNINQLHFLKTLTIDARMESSCGGEVGECCGCPGQQNSGSGRMGCKLKF